MEDFDNENTLRAMHKMLFTLHSLSLEMLNACERLRFDVVDADKYFNRTTKGGVIGDLEKLAEKIRDKTDELNVNIRCDIDAIECPYYCEGLHFRQKRLPWKKRCMKP